VYNINMLRTRNLTLNGTPQELTIDDAVDSPNSISIQNTSDTGYAYIGTQTVSSTSYGHKLFPGQSFFIDLGAENKLYATGDTGVTVSVLILEKA
jgi:hypothetical protein